MKLIGLLMLVHLSTAVAANYRYINDIVAKATPAETKDLSKFVDLMKFEPAEKDPETGIQTFRVIEVKKGSVYDREGMKVGDLFVNGRSPQSSPSDFEVQQ